MKRNKYSRLNIYYHSKSNKYLFYDKDTDKSYLYDEKSQSPNHIQPLGLNSELIVLYTRKNDYDLICYLTIDGDVILYRNKIALDTIISNMIEYGEKLNGIDKDYISFFYKLNIIKKSTS